MHRGGLTAGGDEKPKRPWTRPPETPEVAPAHTEPVPEEPKPVKAAPAASPPAPPGEPRATEAPPASPATPASPAPPPSPETPASPAPPSALATPGAPAPAPPPADFASLASRMGREVVRVSPLFRAGAVIVLVASLLLVAENALVFTSTTSLAMGGGLDSASPTDPSSANQTVSGVFSVAGDFLSSLSFATTLDILGFALLGAGMALLGLGSRGIQIRIRFDGSMAPKSRLIPVGALLAAVCFFGWVGLTTAWRSALTGSPTGDWTGIQSLFDADGIGSGNIIPAPVQQMIDTYPTVTGMWMLATVLLIPAAVGILLAGAGFKRTTGLRAGGVGFLIFSVLALVGVVIFLGSIESLFGAVEQAFATGGEGIEQAFTSLAVAMVVKLLVVPFWAIIGFSMLAIVAIRLSLLRNGAVLLAPDDVRGIKEAGSAVAPPGALAVQPPPPSVGAAVVDPNKDAAAPALAPAGGTMWSELGAPATGPDVIVQLPPQEPKK